MDNFPKITRCCNEHDYCYGTCGSSKQQCDKAFKQCIRRLCDTANDNTFEKSIHFSPDFVSFLQVLFSFVSHCIGQNGFPRHELLICSTSPLMGVANIGFLVSCNLAL